MGDECYVLRTFNLAEMQNCGMYHSPVHVLSRPGVNVKANPEEGLWRGCVAGADTSSALGDLHRVHAWLPRLFRSHGGK